MARVDLLNSLYAKHSDPYAFNWNSLQAPPMLSFLTPYDIQLLEDISRDPRLFTKLKEKREYMNNILEPRGFKRFASGTNRLVYKHLENQDILLKTTISKAGLEDNIREYKNQMFLKPFVPKCFEVSPQGSLGIFERVVPITSKEQFLTIAPEVFSILTEHIIGKYILADIGTSCFMNYGVRVGWGPVIVDYPSMYELDGSKLYCNNIDRMTGIACDGEIDYDDGFNKFICRTCGKQYIASTLAKGQFESGGITLIKRKKGDIEMKVSIIKNGIVTKTTETVASADNYLDAIKVSQEKKYIKDLIYEEDQPERMVINIKRSGVTVNSNRPVYEEVSENVKEETKVPDTNETVKVESDENLGELVTALNDLASAYEPYDLEVARSLRGEIPTTDEIQARSTALLVKNPELLASIKKLTETITPGVQEYIQEEPKEESKDPVVQEEPKTYDRDDSVDAVVEAIKHSNKEFTTNVPTSPDLSAKPLVDHKITAPYPYIGNVNMNCEYDDESDNLQEGKQDSNSSNSNESTKNNNPTFYSKRDMSNY